MKSQYRKHVVRKIMTYNSTNHLMSVRDVAFDFEITPVECLVYIYTVKNIV